MFPFFKAEQKNLKKDFRQSQVIFKNLQKVKT